MKSRCTKVAQREKQKHGLPAILKGICQRVEGRVSSFLYFGFPIPSLPYQIQHHPWCSALIVYILPHHVFLLQIRMLLRPSKSLYDATEETGRF